MFRTLAIRGAAGSLNWGYRPVADLTSWSIARSEPPKLEWTLSARLRRVDKFQVKQRGVYFTAPRLGGGRWFWPIRSLSINPDATALVAFLDPPEQ